MRAASLLRGRPAPLKRGELLLQCAYLGVGWDRSPPSARRLHISGWDGASKDGNVLSESTVDTTSGSERDGSQLETLVRSQNTHTLLAFFAPSWSFRRGLRVIVRAEEEGLTRYFKKQGEETMPRKAPTARQQWKSSPSPSSKSSSSLATPAGTFHLLDALEPKLPKHLDDASSIAASEFDSISNNGSCSGESEDQSQLPSKERAFIPGLDASPDKQEKIRLKNEKKHQRQKERKTKELKERCASYLMSRKLDSLAQQLVPMGFSCESATMALILNEGDMEKSITFLLEDGEIPKTLPRNASLKLDISDQLARLADIETRHGYPLAEIERAIVACEGDIDAALKWLRDHNGQPVAAAPQRQELQASKVAETKLQSAEARVSQLVVPSASPAPAPVPPGLRAVPLPPPPVWQRGASSLHHSLSSVSAAAAAARLDPALKFLEQQSRERDIITDWRNSHPSHQQAMLQRFRRLDEPHLIKSPQQQQQQQQHHHQLQYHQHGAPTSLHHPHPLQQLAPASLSVAPPAQSIHPPWSAGNSSNPSDSWDIPVARSVDYHTIDWSTGIPPSPFAKPATSFGLSSSLPRSFMVRSEGWNRQQSGYRGSPDDLTSQEWTTPFAGKDLVHHQAVPSL
ncbi:uncharacterized protein LOC9655576 [Selaginella moellendorffii]|nr:uncharacterized protein LOC9655576 [Selaginella moellendorffii]|eukprot:XP_002964361.2 uncharacterized protein LOC9655576 [Selaginella moellendorffii]